MANFYGQFIGFGAGGSAAAWIYQGETNAYYAGGYGSGYSDRIDKWVFASDSPTADVADSDVANAGHACGNTELYGWLGSGYSSGARQTAIQKFVFATEADMTSVADCATARGQASGANDTTHGYVFGGQVPGYTTDIERYTFASEGDGASIGDLTEARNSFNGSASDIPNGNGFLHGGENAGAVDGYYSNVIDKFAFSSSSNGADHGDLIGDGYNGNGGFTAYAYAFSCFGTNESDGIRDSIERYAFASNTTATDWADNASSTAKRSAGSASQTNNGYFLAGYTTGNITETCKFPYASQTDMADVGDMSEARRNGTGLAV